MSKLVSGMSVKFVQLVLALTITAWAGTSQGAVVLDKVIAVVNDDPITLSEYQVRYRQEVLERGLPKNASGGAIYGSVVEALIDERVQIQEAARIGVRVSDAEIQQGIQEIASKNNMDIDQLSAFLASDNLTMRQFAKNVKNQQLIRRLVDLTVKPRVRISPQEVDSYLDAHESDTPTNESFEFSHLFVSTEDKSEEQITSELQNLEFILQGLSEGQSFKKAVENYSDGNRDNGGYLGWRTPSQLPRTFLKELRSMGNDGVSQIIQEDNGFHILKLHKKRGGGEMVQQLLVRHILVQPDKKSLSNEEALEYTNDLYQRLKSGEKFDSLARLYSDDRQSMDKGGELGWVRPQELGPVVAQVVQTLPQNTLSQPVKSPFGYHLIEVLDARERDIRYDLVENQARQILFERKTAKLYRNWLDSLKSIAVVDYLVDIDGR